MNTEYIYGVSIIDQDIEQVQKHPKWADIDNRIHICTFNYEDGIEYLVGVPGIMSHEKGIYLGDTSDMDALLDILDEIGIDYEDPIWHIIMEESPS